MKKKIVFTFLCVLGVVMTWAQVNATAKLNKANILIGDQVQLSLSVNFTEGVEIKRVDWTVLDTITNVEVINIEEASVIAHNNGELLEQQVTLTSFDEGRYVIPPIAIVYHYQGHQKKITTNDLALTVETIPLSEEELQQIEPIKDILKTGYMPSLLSIIGLVVAIVLVYLLYRFFRSRKDREEEEVELVLPPPPPAHITALTKLTQLDEKQLWQNGEIKAFQSELTYIFREYLENKFGIQALENTSDEIVDSLKAASVDSGNIEQITNILETADLVKFAKSEPPIEVHAQAFNNILGFINKTKGLNILLTEIEDD